MVIRSIRNRSEYVTVRVALFVLPRLSRPALLRLSRGLGWLAYRFARRLTRVGLANLAIAFPDRTEQEREHILLRSFQTFALSMLDTFWLSRDTEARIGGLVDFDPTYETIFRPGALICVSAHIGNWEVLGMAITHRGHPLASVVAPLKNPLVDPLFNRLRHITGQAVLPRQGAVRHLLRTLRNGGKIALLLDQNTKPAFGGVFVRFFGVPAPVSNAGALLARRTGAGIVIGACLPRKDGTYYTPPLIPISQDDLPPDASAAEKALTQRIADGITELVRAHPEHWLWAYKRWRIRPDGADPAAFPYYARAIRATDLTTRGSPVE